MNEDYCSYELSNALKACGFDEPCDHYYTPNKALRIVKDNALASETANNRFLDEIADGCCTAVPLWHAQKWLRNKGIEAYALLADDNAGYEWGIYDRNVCDNIDSNLGDGYKTYEQALSAGIARAVELIKKGE